MSRVLIAMPLSGFDLGGFELDSDRGGSLNYESISVDPEHGFNNSKQDLYTHIASLTSGLK